MLIPLRPGELQRLIPAVATGNQFRFALGNPQEVLQRLMIAAIGGVITFLIYNQAQLGSRWGPFWLLLSVVFFLYVLWGPILAGGAAATPRFAAIPQRRYLMVKSRMPDHPVSGLKAATGAGQSAAVRLETGRKPAHVDGAGAGR